VNLFCSNYLVTRYSKVYIWENGGFFMRNNLKTKGIAGILTVVVIALLIIAGPVQGFSLGLNMNDNSVDKGDNAIFNLEINIESGEGLPVDELVLILDGPEYMECKFDVQGNVISGCKGVVSIVNTKQVSYGYGYNSGNYNGYGYYFGYGYGYGYSSGMSNKLSYEVTIDTSDYSTGFYDTEFIAKIGSKEFSKSGDKLKINYVYEGNGGSGSGETDGCRTEYRCTEWDTCSINGYQNRLCEKVRPACYAGDTPEILRTCTPGETGEQGSESGGTINVGEGSSSSGITGAAIGSGESRASKLINWLVIIFVATVVILVGLLFIRRLGK
jgi:hypothetical protein